MRLRKEGRKEERVPPRQLHDNCGIPLHNCAKPSQNPRCALRRRKVCAKSPSHSHCPTPSVGRRMHCGVMKTDEKLLITLTLLDVISSRLHCRCTAFSYLEKDPELSFFGVYDGHGGTGVANYLKVTRHTTTSRSDAGSNRVCTEMQENVWARSRELCSLQGASHAT